MSRARRRAGGAAVAGTLLLALGLVAWRLSGSDPVRDEVRAAPTRVAAPDAVAVPAPPRVAAPTVAMVASAAQAGDPGAADAPLPPVDTPLEAVREALEERARRGDHKAACRLALDGAYCREHPLDSQSVAYFEEAIARRGRTTAADVAWIARLEAAHQRALRLCTGLPPRWAEDSSWRWMLQAAQAGDDLLAARFATSPPMDDADFLERPEPWQQYRQHAASLLLAAAARGEVHAIWSLQRLHGAGWGLHGMPNAIERDPRQAAVYAVALQAATRGASLREFEQAAHAARARYSAAEWAAIEREGRALAQEHFAQVTPHDFQQGVFDDVEAQHCERN